jgi:hypothetical protein
VGPDTEFCRSKMDAMTNKIHGILGKRVDASTLIEVTIALIIISMIFGFATVIFLNVQRTGFSVSKVSNYIVLDEVWAKMNAGGDFTSKEYQVANGTIFQSVEQHPENEHLFVIRLELRNQEGKVLAEKKYIKYDIATH